MQILSNLVSSSIIKFLKTTFTRYGILKTVYSDNCPKFQRNYSSEFAHTRSSPKYAQSNGIAEAAVKIVKY